MPVMDYVNELKNQRDKLADILAEKGLQATRDETFNTLIPKVRDVSGGGCERVVVSNEYIEKFCLGEFENAVFEESDVNV
ncbi:MAG: hypothetical protein PUA84_02210 [Oscillospiraceae bacterium]|nr:hypothetical protein [Oscillospiraceae bacterium]